MGEDTQLMEQIIRAKDEKASKCMNEFKKEKSCRKGPTCRFSHAITDQHRNDASLKQVMAERYHRLTGYPLFDHTYSSPNQMDMACWQGKTNCTGESSMTAQHESIYPPTPAAGTFNNIDNSRNAHFMMNNQHQQCTRPMSPSTINAPRPLMGVKVNPPEFHQTMPVNSVPHITPDNIQAINILQGLLSHLMTIPQLANEHLPIVNHP